MPIDDTFNSPSGKTTVEEFSITDPNGDKTALRLPSSESAKAKKRQKALIFTIVI